MRRILTGIKLFKHLSLVCNTGRNPSTTSALARFTLFLVHFFPALSCTYERSAASEHKSKNALSRDGGKKSLMHVRIYDVIQKGRVKFKQYGALFISAKVLSVFL